MSGRRRLLGRLGDAIAGRRLIWFGVRGSDADALRVLSGFTHCFSITAPLSEPLECNDSLETLKQLRVELNAYSTEADPSSAVRELERHLLESLRRDSILVPYRPAAIVTAAFQAQERGLLAGLFHDFQRAFEHKPWVETELRRLGLTVVPWRYVHPLNLAPLAEALKGGPLVIRRERSSGGSGFEVVSDVSQLSAAWTATTQSVISFAPYLDPNVSFNLGGCVFPSGAVHLYAPSVQLVGISCCTNQPFAYCGNDFARPADFGDELMSRLEELGRTVGAWLHRMRYVGAFGIDAILFEGQLYLSEVNPRFQGASSLSAKIAESMGTTDVFTDHLAAFLGVESFSPPSLATHAREQLPISQVVCFNTNGYPVMRTYGEAPASVPTMIGIPARDVTVEPSGMLFKLVVDGAVTGDGHALESRLAASISTSAQTYFGPVAVVDGRPAPRSR